MIKIDPKASSAIVNPTILENLALISPLDELHSVLLPSTQHCCPSEVDLEKARAHSGLPLRSIVL